MLVFFDREGFESSLVVMPRTLRMVVGMPTHRMRVGHPPKEFGNLSVSFGVHNKMPVIGHHATTENR